MNKSPTANNVADELTPNEIEQLLAVSPTPSTDTLHQQRNNVPVELTVEFTNSG